MTMSGFEQRVRHGLVRHGVALDAAKIEQLSSYLALLERWNARMNLTALEDPQAAVDRLIVEPILAAQSIDVPARVLVDVGSGGGSPAIPLRIAKPDLLLTMIESKARKSVFLREVARHLGLADVLVESGRFEDVLSRPEVLGTIDVLSARAVKVGADELRLFAAALRPGGQQLWFTSGTQPTSELPGPFALESEAPLVTGLRSRLLVLRKALE